MSCDYCWPGNCCGGLNCMRAPMVDRERKTQASGPIGNLYQAYGGSTGWMGCADQDCLLLCDTSKGHCERLRLFLERRAHR